MQEIFKYQQWHLLSLVGLLLGIYFILGADSSILSGELWGIHTRTWFIIALLSPILHQIYVVILWRYELYGKRLTQRLGESAFKKFKVGFTMLILSRPVTAILLALSNAHSLEINSTLAYAIAALLFLPILFLQYSIKKYFGIDRAFGEDHFYPEKYRNDTMIKKGIFKYSSNAMYVYGFLLFWAIAFLFRSKAALLLALFSHIYIWAHYFFTEKPDMDEIYGLR